MSLEREYFLLSEKFVIMKKVEKILAVAGIAAIAAVIANRRQVRVPHGAKPVKNFDVLKYLGKWYEIARLDYKYERNLINVTAEYTPNPDGSIKVKNTGYDVDKETWETRIGEAEFVGRKDRGRLKVSFFKPIWSGYNIIDIDKDYKHALVVGNNTKYLWILSRDKDIPDEVRDEFLIKAIKLGYSTTDLIWTHQE